jgi:hypothetical protein
MFIGGSAEFRSTELEKHAEGGTRTPASAMLTST